MLKDSCMAKVALLYDLLNERLQSFTVVQEDLSIDESMLHYFGRHSYKQLIRAKLIRFGYKLHQYLKRSSDNRFSVIIGSE